MNNQRAIEGYASATKDERDKITMSFAPLVKIIATRLAMRLPPHIEIDDLINVGIAGLIEAIDRFDPTKGVKVETFISFRVKGAMLDELRKMDWMPRSVRQKARKLEEEFVECELKLGYAPSDEEMAIFLEMELEDYYKLLHDASGASIMSFEDMGYTRGEDERNIMECIADPNCEDPVAELNLAETRHLLSNAIEELSEKEQLVLSLYYFDDLNLKEVGKVIGVSESRVCQLHSQAVIRLKGKLKKVL